MVPKTLKCPKMGTRTHGGTTTTMVVIVMVMVMMMVEQSMELRWNHPMHDVVDMINKNGGPFIALVLAFPAEELPLLASHLFVPNSLHPFVHLSGRKFNIGRIEGVDVIYVMTGEQTVNAALTVEVLLESFDVKGVVHYGIAGGTNTSLNVGDVIVPDYVAFTSSWKWKEFGTTEKSEHELEVGAYNLPEGGENELAKIQFTPVQLYADGQPMEELFWLPIDPLWFNMATQLKGVNLQRCVNETTCLSKRPEIVFGLKGATSNVFLANVAYANFLYKDFNISITDEESAAVVLASLSNGVPAIVIRGVSDVCGGEKLELAGLSSLAAINSFKVAINFIQSIAKKSFTL